MIQILKRIFTDSGVPDDDSDTSCSQPSSDEPQTASSSDNASIKSEEISNPISLFKAMKNPIELKGSIKSHEKDGVALLRFLRWFKSTKVID